MPMRQTLAGDSWMWSGDGRRVGGAGGRGASSVQTKVRVGGTSRDGCAARCSPGGGVVFFERFPEDHGMRHAACSVSRQVPAAGLRLGGYYGVRRGGQGW
jgi:hypothetical protein